MGSHRYQKSVERSNKFVIHGQMWLFVFLYSIVEDSYLLYFTFVELFCHQRRVDIQSDVYPSPCC